MSNIGQAYTGKTRHSSGVYIQGGRTSHAKDARGSTTSEQVHFDELLNNDDRDISEGIVNH